MKSIKITLLILLISLVTHAQIPANLALDNLFTASSPVALRHAGDGSGRLFVVEQAGRIKIWDGSSLLATNFLDITAKVSSGGERGLLGLDFDPDYANNGFFYVNYTKSGSDFGDTIIERYSVNPTDANIADAASGVVIMRIFQHSGNHNGGDIHFGPDGFLYIGMGDGGGGGDTGNHAQNLSELVGKMLRIDVSTDPIFKNSFESVNTVFTCGLDSTPGSYRIPSDNPYVGTTSECGEIWSYGLRNPWRWSFDKLTGDMIIGDVGQNAYEEVNFQPAASIGGENYGWRCREGAHDFNTSQCSISDVYVEPVIDLPQAADGGCSVMGGYVYRGPIADIQGMYIFSDFCTGNINFATPAAGPWSFTTWQNVGSGTRGFGEDEDGNIYIIVGSTISKFILN